MKSEQSLEHPGDPETAQLQNPSRASEIVELVVMTCDDAFLQTLRTAVGGSRRLWHVPTADKVGDLLLAGQVGILVLDAQSLREPTSDFVSQLKRQFPDLVVMVAAHRDAELSLAGLVSNGSIYRLIHKPLSPGRAQSFTDAAVKKFSAQRRRGPKTAVASMRPRTPRWALWGAGGVVAVSVILFVVRVLLIAHAPAEPPGVVPPAPQPIRAPQAQGNAPLLDRAATALSDNRLTPPAVDNALDLYSSALARDPSDAAARAGLSEVHERLLARAENALLEERFGEAATAIEAARRGGVENGRIAFLTSELKKARDQQRTALTAARPEPHPAPQAAQDPPVHSVAPTVATAAPPVVARETQTAPQPPALQADEGPAEGATTAAAPNPSTKQAEPPDSRNEIVAAAQLTTVKTVSPVYPRKAELAATTGWVALEFTVAETGSVKDIVVADARPRGVFDAAAVTALSQWIYQPVLRDGKPAPQRARIRLRFQLRD